MAGVTPPRILTSVTGTVPTDRGGDVARARCSTGTVRELSLGDAAPFIHGGGKALGGWLVWPPVSLDAVE